MKCIKWLHRYKVFVDALIYLEILTNIVWLEELNLFYIDQQATII